ncbi:MAG: hypothetical protein A2676_04045 [Candidatus Sungbacteria bacterium RIFCSPHIGHO2_01_FULL_51_22]|uniref:valine--tRNA ligase n=1 Tax=Candidatus Sungbacteria bacterium RIFCSPHIGHO2_02_FULL_51_29 TaxID=1802273 RepID=A0A1G2KTE6_9BACT|nr:MAG: hypothetical protein A2676_04045 [Candidatus Sungbacteria bacterium RIFCSPHIGHO2_01_FULL_51_22]OHA01731.1 MAG: hypothetical protein A3C16_04525 [Candidatus Sungbacteria bacterium RIFCSPHIGHO2_02_FULL_51_29]OHA07849.1 MAG: hypothetical protein A3B29_00755 [Candidatus Sungbacteria bacterium RIFCSPLOWO2_01_FULL_51_34]
MNGTEDLEPQYDPKKVEDRIYKLWEESGFFNPDTLPGKREKTYTIAVPPPNVTGSLHMGHALNATIQDILIRKKRMEGYKTLWLPGTDHAGIATQNVVEKELKKQGTTRYDLGRQAFIARVWEWKEKYGDIILEQFKKLGSSMDWSRTRFTMDPEYQKAVEEAFLHYYRKGWMYRAERVVNWCVRCQTSLSDLELEYKEEKAMLYYIQYPILSRPGEHITVATVRPETMLGDSAVAVNPKDERYRDIVGAEVLLPIQDRPIPVITDEAIDKEFGTGAVKVTPAHDPLDADIGAKNNLPVYKVIDERGKMTALAGPLCEGVKASECRERVVSELKAKNLLVKEESYPHNVSLCYRCGTAIEPQPSMQWFLKMSELGRVALDAVNTGRVTFYPDRWKDVYTHWMGSVRDWNISRQIWWGHRIPLWRCSTCDEAREKPELAARWFLVRHGETEWNKEMRYMGREDIPLNDAGREQARTTAAALKDTGIDIIVSSDLARASETARIIGRELGIDVIENEHFRERHMGEWQGKTTHELKEIHTEEGFTKIRFHYDEAYHGGESWREVEGRVMKGFQDLRQKYQNKNVLIVSHGGTIRMIVKNIRNLHFDVAVRNEPSNGQSIELSIAREQCKNCGNEYVEPIEDVLDTWFSSALWPFATLGWPEHIRDLKEFYPTSVLSTARDIINLWVARMVYSGLEFMDGVPFSDVIIHATILTKDGKRMSKSLGTGIDPMTLIEKYGADATRFGIVWQAMGNQDIHWAEEHVNAGKKFANKVWNAARFVLMNAADPSAFDLSGDILHDAMSDDDKKVLALLEETKKNVGAHIDAYEFGHALHELYEFFWREFCDVYIERSKKARNDAVAVRVLTESLKLLHPFMPFLTEEVWARIPLPGKSMLIVSEWPLPHAR